ncbi:hypothetical protein MNBD_GAMMA02-450 [hydrothermal vent metagenome]|uniref:Uncharacterized protein n=1 Tax=hydrothermal vent metagenome TaxID=652676 RepID=A0A3B0W186_9ZZZZ
MTDNNITQLHQTFGNYKLAQDFYVSVCSFFYQMDVNGQEFVDEFVDSYIEHVNNKSKRLSDVILETGFTKTIIQKSLNGIRHSRQYTTKTFFFDIMMEIQSICEKSPDKTMLIKGSRESYTQLFYKYAPSTKHLSAKSFLEHLIKRGIVRVFDEFSIQFINSIPTHHENTKDKMMDLFSLEIQRFTHTLIRNFKAENDDEKNFQLTLVSKYIHPDKHDAVRHELTELARKHLSEYQQLLDAHEEATDFGKKSVEKTGSELGISTFIFNFNPNEE